jgi:hypothetical protein
MLLMQCSFYSLNLKVTIYCWWKINWRELFWVHQGGYIFRRRQPLALMLCCFCSLNLKLTILQRKVLLVGVCGYCILQGGYIFRSSPPLALLQCCFCSLNLKSQYCNWKSCWWVCMDIAYSKEDTFIGAASQWRLCINQLCCNETQRRHTYTEKQPKYHGMHNIKICAFQQNWLSYCLPRLFLNKNSMCN